MFLNDNCGGIVCMHNMVKTINDLKNKNINAKIFNPLNIIYENEFTDQFCDLDEINDNYIDMYNSQIILLRGLSLNQFFSSVKKNLL